MNHLHQAKIISVARNAPHAIQEMLILFLISYVAFCAIPAIANAQQAKIPAASITSIVRSVDTAGAIDVKGKAQPRTTINVEIVSDESGPLLRQQTVSNEAGDWLLTIGDSSFKDGAYTLRAIVQDSGGLLGPVTEVRGYKVQPKPLLDVNGYQFGWLDAFIGALFIMFLAASIGSWYYEHRRRIHEEQLLMAERDIHSMSHNLMEEVERLDHLIRDSKGMDPHVAAEAEYLLKSQQNKLEKMKGMLAIEPSKVV
jgi:hypothetical protein